MTTHLLTALQGLWGLDRSTHTALVATVLRGLTGSPGTPPSADPERRLVSIRDGVAVLQMTGVLWRLDDWDVALRGYGFSTYQRLALDLDAALASTEVRAICLHVDSPGGQVSGCDELAQRIADAAAVKPVWVHVDGDCCSAAYVACSGASRIVANPTAAIGSLGVILGLVDWSGYYEQMGIREYEFISSVSPNKNPDPGTAEGRAQWQQLVDETGRAMVERVATRRGITVDELLARYGQGAVLVAPQALEAGLIDEVNTLEATLTALRAATAPTSATRAGVPRATASSRRASLPGAPMNENEEIPAGTPPDLEATVATRLTAERARIGKLLQLAGVAMPDSVTTAIAEGTTPEAFALAVLEARQAQQAAPTDPRVAAQAAAKANEEKLANAGLTVPAPSTLEKPDARAQKRALLRAGAKSVGTLRSPAT